MLQNLLIGRHTHRATGLSGATCSSPAGPRRAEIAAREKVEQVIDLLDLQHHRDSMVAGLPYGVRKVVELARALCTEPKLLLLDEPSSGLNVEETDDMAFWIQDIQHELGITVLMVEHDMTLVSKVSDRVLAMNQGEVLATGHAARGADASGRDRGLPGLGRRRVDAAEGSRHERESCHGRERPPVLKLSNVESAYGPIRAIRGVSLQVRARRDRHRARLQRRRQDDDPEDHLRHHRSAQGQHRVQGREHHGAGTRRTSCSRACRTCPRAARCSRCCRCTTTC